MHPREVPYARLFFAVFGRDNEKKNVKRKKKKDRKSEVSEKKASMKEIKKPAVLV